MAHHLAGEINFSYSEVTSIFENNRNSGIISSGENLREVTSNFKQRFPGKLPCVFKVPRKDEEIVALRC